MSTGFLVGAAIGFVGMLIILMGPTAAFVDGVLGVLAAIFFVVIYYSIAT